MKKEIICSVVAVIVALGAIILLVISIRTEAEEQRQHILAFHPQSDITWYDNRLPVPSEKAELDQRSTGQTLEGESQSVNDTQNPPQNPGAPEIPGIRPNNAAPHLQIS